MSTLVLCSPGRRRVMRGRRRGIGDDAPAGPCISCLFMPGAERWRSQLASMAPDIPTNFLIAWLEEESGGNPCSLGITTPGKQEAGIWQTMHPQDDKYGATYDQLRQGCTGQTVTDASAVDNTAQMAGINMVRDYMARTTAQLAAVGVPWGPDSSDYWKAVKSIHGLPCILSDLLPRVVAKSGPPATWDDFRDKVMQMSPSEMGAGCAAFFVSPSHEGTQNRLDDIFSNATKAGRWGGGVLSQLPLGGSSASLLLLGGAAAVLYLLLR